MHSTIPCYSSWHSYPDGHLVHNLIDDQMQNEVIDHIASTVLAADFSDFSGLCADVGHPSASGTSPFNQKHAAPGTSPFNQKHAALCSSIRQHCGLPLVPSEVPSRVAGYCTRLCISLLSSKLRDLILVAQIPIVI